MNPESIQHTDTHTPFTKLRDKTSHNSDINRPYQLQLHNNNLQCKYVQKRK